VHPEYGGRQLSSRKKENPSVLGQCDEGSSEGVEEITEIKQEKRNIRLTSYA